MTLVVDKYVEGLRARRMNERAARALRVSAVRAELDRAAELLRERYGVTRVVLFGSFARGDARQDSDVDLLVDGLAPEEYFNAAADVSRLLQRDVDLVRDRDASPLLLERIERHGVIVGG